MEVPGQIVPPKTEQSKTGKERQFLTHTELMIKKLSEKVMDPTFTVEQLMDDKELLSFLTNNLDSKDKNNENYLINNELLNGLKRKIRTFLKQNNKIDLPESITIGFNDKKGLIQVENPSDPHLMFFIRNKGGKLITEPILSSIHNFKPEKPIIQEENVKSLKNKLSSYDKNIQIGLSSFGEINTIVIPKEYSIITEGQEYKCPDGFTIVPDVGGGFIDGGVISSDKSQITFQVLQANGDILTIKCQKLKKDN